MMKRFSRLVVVLVCMTALCAVVAGCSSSGGSSAASGSGSASASASAQASASAAVASSAAQPTAGVSPADIDPGQVTGSSDIWRLNGDVSAEGIRFETSGNEAGLSFYRVNASGEDGDGEFNLVITDEKHLRTPQGTAPKIDIVFTDAMNCYDYVTGNWYKRG